MKRWIFLPVATVSIVAVSHVPLGERQTAPAPAAPATERPQPATTGRLVPTADWFDDIFRGLARQRGQWESRRPSPSQGEDREEEDDTESARPGGGRFRTMCVRLCDGFPFPISFSTPRSHFASDAQRCSAACPGARLFVYRNPGGEMDEMVDLEGRPYRKLPAASLYQHTYVANCTCRGNPWDPQEIARHKGYADQAAQALAKPGAAAKPGEGARPTERASRRRARWAQRPHLDGED
jgi:hypothetical protein